ATESYGCSPAHAVATSGICSRINDSCNQLRLPKILPMGLPQPKNARRPVGSLHHSLATGRWGQVYLNWMALLDLPGLLAPGPGDLARRQMREAWQGRLRMKMPKRKKSLTQTYQPGP